jgi:hypothetical protein
MSNNSRPAKSNAAFVLALLLFIPLLWAQPDRAAAAEPLYEVRLSWNGDENTLRFEAVVEKVENGLYRSTVRRFTSASSIKLPLTEGQYRFRVIPYDFLNKPGKSSDWTVFEIKPAAIAEVHIKEEPKKEEPIKEIPVIEQAEDKKETPIYLFIKAFDGYISLGWMPIVPIHAFEEHQFFGQDPSLIGAGARFGVAYDEIAFINPGMEFSVTWYAYDNQYVKVNTFLPQAITIEMALIAQKWLPSRTFAFTFRMGVGITMIQNSLIIEGNNQNHDSFNANIGLSFLFLPKESLYLEAGVDYVFLFSQTFPGYFRPSLGIGWRM